MRLRVRSPTGVRTLNLSPDTTLAELRHQLHADTIRAGYPPRHVTAPDTQPISALFSEGDVIIVSTSAALAPSPVSRPPQTRTSPYATSLAAGSLAVRVVPDDNSCMFRSVNFLLSRPNTARSIMDLRTEVSAVVSSASSLYNTAFLGRPNSDYCAWIMSEAAWGGAIELSILAERFAVELAAFDIKSMRLDRYGEGNGYSTIGFLVYDGIHYNYIAEGCRGAPDVTLFDVKDTTVVQRAKALVQKEHDANKYTDTANFALKCGQCGTRLKGEKEALQHAKSTVIACHLTSCDPCGHLIEDCASCHACTTAGRHW